MLKMVVAHASHISRTPATALFQPTAPVFRERVYGQPFERTKKRRNDHYKNIIGFSKITGKESQFNAFTKTRTSDNREKNETD